MTDLPIHLAGDIRIPHTPPAIAADILAGLEVSNPAYLRAVRRPRHPDAPPLDIPPRISLARLEGDCLYVPRGARGEVWRALSQRGYHARYVDGRTDGVPLEVDLRLDLRPYQAHAVEAAYLAYDAVVSLPCGGGKTSVGLGLVARVRRSTLVLVHTLDLAEQWIARARSDLGVTAGLAGDGHLDLRPLTIATVQTLVALPRTALEEIGARYGLVIVDEAHHAPASTFADVLAALPARHRLGLTATPQRSDRLPLEPYLGPTVASATVGELIAGGWLSGCRVVPVRTGFAAPWAEDYRALLGAIADDPDRLALVAYLAGECARRGRSTLVLVGRVELARAIGARLVEDGVRAEVLTGATKAARRPAILDALRAGDISCVVATQLADEGLDVPGLERLILATPSRDASRTAQRIGRLMRRCPGKAEPVVLDLVDEHPTAQRQWVARRRVYRRLGSAVVIERERRVDMGRVLSERAAPARQS